MALNVLIVDDSAVMRAMIARTLRLAGLPVDVVHQAEDGVAALEVLADAWVDVALVDINMPGMNGEDLIMRLRSDEATADLPVLVVSTEGGEPRMARLRAARVAFLRKPFTPEALCAEIVRLTGIQVEGGSDEACSDLDF